MKLFYGFGIVISQGRSSLDKVVRNCLVSEEDSELSVNGKILLQDLYSELLETEEKLAVRNKDLEKVSQKSEEVGKSGRTRSDYNNSLISCTSKPEPI